MVGLAKDNSKGDGLGDNEDIPTLYKKASYQPVSGSKIGLSQGLDVVDGRLTEKPEEPTEPRGVLRGQSIRDITVTHSHQHVQIGGEVSMVAIDIPEQEDVGAAKSASFHAKTANVSRADSDYLDARKVIDEEFERKHEKHHAKVQINKGTLRAIQNMYPNDEKKQDNFLESILAAQHVRDLTTRYGSKQKNVRQYFLEAVDADTKLAVFGSEDIEEAQLGLKKLDQKRKPFNLTDSVSMSSLPEQEETQKTDTDSPDNTLDSTNHTTQSTKEETEPLVGVWSKKNFWESLERLEFEQAPDEENACQEGGAPNTLFEIYGPKWKRSQKLAKNAEAVSTKTDTAKHELEEFPDKYLEPGVQEVQQSEAVRRLWCIVNEQLELLGAKDPIAYEMFGHLYDEVRNFSKLPEEDVIEFNNGIWEPEPLDEKQILSMEPFEKLMTRFSVYQKAFCFMAQHFELMTPIFAEIKRAYEDVFEKGEKETIEVEKEQMEELELRRYLGKHVRLTDQAGHKLLMETKAEALALQEHIQWQHHTLHTILQMLWKMRSSLKMTSWAVGQLKNMHKSKVEALAKETVNTQRQLLFDMALPGKFTEIMRRIKDLSDVKEIRRMLLAARRRLRASYKRLVVFEADYADTIPKTEYEIVQKKFNIISNKNLTLREACADLKTKRQEKLDSIAAMHHEVHELKEKLHQPDLGSDEDDEEEEEEDEEEEQQ